jgi:hypothetical protein
MLWRISCLGPANALRPIATARVHHACRRRKALEAGLRDLGWISGRNLKIDYRWTFADAGSLRTQAAELVAAKSELIGRQHPLRIEQALADWRDAKP